MKSKFLSYAWEIGKWLLVLYLIMPLATAMNGTVGFARVVVGEALLIIFIGKIFYDTVIWKFVRQQQARGRELIGMLGMLAAIGFILIMFFLLAGVTTMIYVRSQLNMPGPN
ncbi:MAG: hypothetical protein V3U73_12790 [bacterium]